MRAQRPAEEERAEAEGGQLRVARKLVVRLAILAAIVLLTGAAIGQYDTKASEDNYLAAVLEKSLKSASKERKSA